MRKRKMPAGLEEVEDPAVKARVLAVLWALSGEKPISEICRETGLAMVQYYKLESQLLRGMVMAAQASLQPGRRRNPILEAQTLEERTTRLRQEHLRLASMVRLTRKLFKAKGMERKVRRGRPPKSASLPKETPETTAAAEK